MTLKSHSVIHRCNQTPDISEPASGSGSFIYSAIRLLQNSGYLFILLLPLLFSSCSEKSADHENFVNAYVDLRLAEDTIKSKNTDIQRVKAEILKKYGLTEEKYNSSFQYFEDNPELWEQFYDKAIARVDTLKKKK